MMALINEIYALGSINRAELRTLLLLLNPFAPHMTEEMYEVQNLGGVLNEQKWPTFDPALCVDEMVELVVQINGRYAPNCRFRWTVRRRMCWKKPRRSRRSRTLCRASKSSRRYMYKISS